MANIFALLANFDEADRYLRAVEQLHEAHNVSIHISYYVEKGSADAGLGREKEAFASFERAIEMAQNDTDPYVAAARWSDYGLIAWRFGRTKLAKANFEHALLVARQNGIGWFLPILCLWYAEFLMCMGEYSSAYEYFMEALSSDAQAFLLDEIITYVGIPLALHMKDETTLAKCVRPHVIDRAFLSGEPTRIGSVAVAFARLYTARGQNKKAQTLLHRAVQAIHTVDMWELPLEVARCGAKRNFQKARGFLEARTALPNAQVAEACLHLFDAFVAQREGRHADAYAQARDAASRFDGLQWAGIAALARSVLPLDEQQQHPSEMRPVQPFSDMHATFTGREREVAAYVLKGLTNRAIAEALSITENTIEKHVASVMNKLGIRSRYQLADAITSYGIRDVRLVAHLLESESG